jgi:hypothetical protein
MTGYPSPLLPVAATELKRIGGSLAGPIEVTVAGVDRTLSIRALIKEEAVQPATESMPSLPARRGREFSPVEEAMLAVMSKE